MPNYKVAAINIGSFNLGESDKLLTIFSAERGLFKVVAKGARKPGRSMTGRSELLNINHLFLATGKSLDIITQAETIETFSRLRKDLVHLSYGLYYAELTRHFGTGLTDESQNYFSFLQDSLRLQSEAEEEATILSLRFELGLLDMLGYKPELINCVSCRQAISEYLLARFHHDWGGVVCKSCSTSPKTMRISEEQNYDVSTSYNLNASSELTPLVWKQLVLASSGSRTPHTSTLSKPLQQSLFAAQRLIQTYLEHKANRKMKSLDLVKNLPLSK